MQILGGWHQDSKGLHRIDRHFGCRYAWSCSARGAQDQQCKLPFFTHLSRKLSACLGGSASASLRHCSFTYKQSYQSHKCDLLHTRRVHYCYDYIYITPNKMMMYIESCSPLVCVIGLLAQGHSHYTINCDSIDVNLQIDFQSCYHNVCLFRTRMIEVCSLSGLAIA